MKRRLVDRFAAGQHVLIRFADDTENTWHAAVVIEPSHPGLWVQMEDGRLWYVTNGRRIRAREEQA